jgi:NAD(P)-dependent dehydrogenase (short-subunit alcohol dehydrogenase family)
MVADINLDAANQVAALSQAAATAPGFRAEAVHVDVTVEESVSKAVSHTVKQFGRIDYCINCAGVSGFSRGLSCFVPRPLSVSARYPSTGMLAIAEDETNRVSVQIGVQVATEIADTSASEFSRFLDVNVTGTFLVTRDVSAAMKAQEPRLANAAQPERGSFRGAIVNMGSASSFVSSPMMVQYTTSKHAVLGLTRNAGELLLFPFFSGWKTAQTLAAVFGN